MTTNLAVHEARARAGRIREGIRYYLATLAEIAEAYKKDDWRTLGYADWTAYVDGEFGETRLKLSREMRQKAVVELRLAGLSQRAIGSAVGASIGTVNADLAATASGVQKRTPEPITGRDGRSYPSTKPERPKPLPEPEPERPEPDAAPPESTRVEPSDDGDARRDAELDAAMESTDVRFRRNFSTAMRRAAEVWSFDPDRIAEVYAADFDQSIGRTFLREMTAFCQRVEQAHTQRPGATETPARGLRIRDTSARYPVVGTTVTDHLAESGSAAA